MIFSYVTVIPALLSGYLWWRKSVAEIKLADTLSLYGYCLTLFIPISVSPSLQIPYSDIGYLSFIIERGRVLPLLTLKQRSKYVLADGEEHSTWTAPRDIQLGYISFGSRGKISGRVS